MKTLLEKKRERGCNRNPECCGYEMEEVESTFINEIGEYEIVGHKCNVCGIEADLYGKEMR